MKKQKKPRNIIILSLDDLRFDCLSFLGQATLSQKLGLSTQVATPMLDSIAGQSVVFSNAFSTCSFTIPSHASMLTGLYPYRHGLRTFYGAYAKGVVTLAEMLASDVFAPRARVEHVALAAMGITRGFREIDNYVANDWNILTDLRKNDENLFLFLHLFDVHKPYRYIVGREGKRFNSSYHGYLMTLCEKYSVDFSRLCKDAEDEAKRVVKDFEALPPALQEFGLYRSLDYLLRKAMGCGDEYCRRVFEYYIDGVNYFDQSKLKFIIGLFKEKGIWDDSLVIITSDHGEEKGIFNNIQDIFNGTYVYEGQIRVPLLIKLPGQTTQKIVTEPVSHVDLVPTVLSLSGIGQTDIQSDGYDLAELIEHNTPLPERFLYSESFKNSGGINYFGNINPRNDSFIRTQSIRDRGYKFVKTGGINPVVDPSSDIDHIRTCYRNSIGRFENTFEIIIWKALLRGALVSQETMKALFDESADYHKIRYELYDLKTDPECRDNIAYHEASAGQIERYRSRLRRMLSCVTDTNTTDNHEAEDIEDKLRSLGYI